MRSAPELYDFGRRPWRAERAGRHLYRVDVAALIDPNIPEAEVAKSVEDLGEKGASDRLEADAEGRIYLTEHETNGILWRLPEGRFEMLVHDSRVLWPDTLSLAADGYLYLTANQLHRQARFHEGKELREKPYALFRIRVDGKPVELRK